MVLLSMYIYGFGDPLTLYIDAVTDNCWNFVDDNSLNIDVHRRLVYLFVCFARLFAGIGFETIQSETTRLISQRFPTFRQMKKSVREL